MCVRWCFPSWRWSWFWRVGGCHCFPACSSSFGFWPRRHILIYSDWNKRGQERVINFFALSVGVPGAPRSPLVWHCLPDGGAFGFLFRKWQQQQQSVTTTTTTVVRFVAVGSKFSSNYNYYDLCFGFDLVHCLRAQRTHNWALFWTVNPLRHPVLHFMQWLHFYKMVSD